MPVRNNLNSNIPYLTVAGDLPGSLLIDVSTPLDRSLQLGCCLAGGQCRPSAVGCRSFGVFLVEPSHVLDATG